jgi:hypothetical protein
VAAVVVVTGAAVAVTAVVDMADVCLLLLEFAGTS